MSRIQARFEALRRAGRKALIPYVTAGDPDPQTTVPLMHAMVEAGADIIELGVPFSDPMADGPVIQAACERALRHHMSLRRVLEMVAEFRRDNDETPVLLMGYLNPIEAMGCAEFSAAAQQAGVDGVLTVDLPPEEAGELVAGLRTHEIDPIFLLSPTTTDARVARIVEQAGGFLYYVSFKGVTGATRLDVDAVAEKVGHLKSIAALPIGVGFGIRDAESAARISQVADAVIVGSALVRHIAESTDHPETIKDKVAEELRAMRAAMDAKQPAAAVS
ncbi:tryptophan synthase subunit alpha [Thiohalobacter thiocyanaticus]|uniref:Tryptophan synthase alpha chain n=1 Tax=Thiohalobacter thiocyanaticus TaxID=585455 RepID=A0A426QGH6_9GAMM|nr:tryptophan synthase subunit alpha [Thiohalobacter thiocyanaticus]RRQ20843.1 tryptophan synthase subunit alpha [Thiohalobacter thiocyanaticus]